MSRKALSRDAEVFRTIPSDSSTAIVAFSAAGVKPGVFHLTPLLDGLPGFTKLYVRDPRSRWYNDGLPGVGHTLAEVAGGIEAEVQRLGATRVITVGPSMGGYAAILFGCLIGAERVIAVAPQTLLDQGLRHAPPADLDPQAPDLAPIVSEAPNTRIDVVAGWNDHLDVFHARRIAAQPSVRVLALPYQLHRYGRKLSPARRRTLTGALFAEEPLEDCQVNPRIDPDTEARIADTAFAEQRGDWKTVAERIGPVTDRYPEWAGPKLDLGRALAKMEDWDAAESACRQASQCDPDWTQPRAELVRVLLEQNRPEEAEETVREGLLREPDWPSGHLLLARCLSRLGHSAEARSATLRAVELNPKLKQPTTSPVA